MVTVPHRALTRQRCCCRTHTSSTLARLTVLLPVPSCGLPGLQDYLRYCLNSTPLEWSPANTSFLPACAQPDAVNALHARAGKLAHALKVPPFQLDLPLVLLLSQPRTSPRCLTSDCARFVKGDQRCMLSCEQPSNVCFQVTMPCSREFASSLTLCLPSRWHAAVTL